MLSLSLRRLYAESGFGGNILVPLCIRTANERDNIVSRSGFCPLFRCGQDNVSFILCGNAEKRTGNVGDILYGNDVYVWRIGGIMREMGGLYQLFQCFSAIFYPEGQQSLKDPVMCRYRSLRRFLRSNGNSRETIRE